jgi:hypothetical protein
MESWSLDRWHPWPAPDWIGNAFSRRFVPTTKMMGWDEDGRPLPATLIDHHLEWTLAAGHTARV